MQTGAVTSYEILLKNFLTSGHSQIKMSSRSILLAGKFIMSNMPDC